MTNIELSRRLMLQKAAAAIGSGAILGTIATSAAAQFKPRSPQQVAGYQSTPNGGQRCSGCRQFQPPRACKVVAGRISPEGWCRIYFAK